MVILLEFPRKKTIYIDLYGYFPTNRIRVFFIIIFFTEYNSPIILLSVSPFPVASNYKLNFLNKMSHCSKAISVFYPSLSFFRP